MGIEEFLGLSKEDIERRMNEVEKNIRTKPGIEYINTRLKEFEVQPWPFILYLAYWKPDILEEILGCYQDYDGPENAFTVREKLREMYILGKTLENLTGKGKPHSLRQGEKMLI